MSSPEPAFAAAAADASAAARGPGASPRWPWLVLLLLPVVIYGWAWNHDLLYIDDNTLYLSPLLHDGAWRGMVDVWTSEWFDDYAPVTMLTLWLDRALGDGPGHWHIGHVQNALWLGIGAMAVFASMRRIATPRNAWAVGLLYAVHPVCADAVLWLAERKSLVAFALAWWCLERHIAWRQGGGWRACALAWVLGVAALLAKPHAVAIPVMMAAWELAVGADGAGILGVLRAAWADGIGTVVWRVAARMMACAPMALVVALFVAVQMHWRNDVGGALIGGSRLAALWCDGWILAHYLAFVAWPSHLTIYYRIIEDPAQVAVLGGCWAAVAAAVAASFAVARRRSLVACGWLFAGAGLLPALNLVAQIVPMTDYYLQWGLPGLLLVVVVVVEDAASRLGDGNAQRTRGLAMACTGVAACLALLSVLRVPEFASRATFFTIAYLRQPDCTMDFAGYIRARVETRGPFQRDTGAMALAGIDRPDTRICIMTFVDTLVVEAAVEAWRRRIEAHQDDGRAAAWAVLEREHGHYANADLVLITWTRILAAVGTPSALAEADQALTTRLGAEFLDQAIAFGTRCRDGNPLPDGVPAVTAVRLRQSYDAADQEETRKELLELALNLVNVRLRLGLTITDPGRLRANDDSAFGISALCLNIAPDFQDARTCMATMYQYLGRDDLAARVRQGSP